MEDTSYVLPLRWRDDASLAGLTGYLRRLAKTAEVIVVDGSLEQLFENHRAAWGAHVRHVRPDPRRRARMGKVAGVLTGVELASNERVVIADDDVRYDPEPLARVATLLGDADLVWPQNYFDPLPWHALWDTGRTLINRALSHDYPGTVAVRRSLLLAAGGYDGDVMFENLELRRTIEAAGGRVDTPHDLYVRRLPPTTGHFLSQRVRQAYDDLALPLRMSAFLSVLPALGAAATRKRWTAIAAAAAGVVALAEYGRRKDGGRLVFPARASAFAPAWVLERGVTSWIVLWERFARGGVAYGETRIRSAATSRRVLRRMIDARGHAQPDSDSARRICSA